MTMGKNNGAKPERDRDDERAAHDVAEQPHRQRQRPGELADDVERQHHHDGRRY
jgi:hypothetical protein